LFAIRIVVRYASKAREDAMKSEMGKHYSSALRNYTVALDLDSKALHGKGRVLLELQKYEDALEEFEKLIELSPNNLEGYYGKCAALNTMNKV
jgi:tetratricopeptide (TPR) repeat protein